MAVPRTPKAIDMAVSDTSKYVSVAFGLVAVAGGRRRLVFQDVLV
jgi:hypothetical protein